MRPQHHRKFAMQVALGVRGPSVLKDTAGADKKDFVAVLAGKTPANIMQACQIDDIKSARISVRERRYFDVLAALDNANGGRQVTKLDEETIVLAQLSKVRQAQRDIVGEEL